MKFRWLFTFASFAAMSIHAHAQETSKRAMTVDDLLAVKVVSDPQVSPDGTLVVYGVSEVDREANKSNSSLYLVPTAGGEPRRLTTTPGSNDHPRWSPDGKSIAFTSDRSGSSQVWLLPIDGGEPRQVTKLPIDVSGPIWSPKGDKIAFVAEVYPGKSPEETAKTDEEKSKDQTSMKVYESLPVRHWTTWDAGKRSHLFVCEIDDGKSTDLIPDWEKNVPPAPFGGSSDYAWGTNGDFLVFTSEPRENHAWSTNTDIWYIPAGGGDPLNVSADNKGADGQPAFAPDGSKGAIVSQARAGFEADQWVLKVRDIGGNRVVDLTGKLDRPVQSFSWTPDSKSILTVVEDSGSQVILKLDAGGGEPTRLVEGGANTSAQPANPDGSAVVYLHSDVTRPNEVFYLARPGAEPTRLTDHNGPLLAKLDLPKAESFTFKGAQGDEVQGWLVRPPGFDESKSYPVLFLIHGGPQGAWQDVWHSRWSYGLFAAPGYAVVAINPRGSTGFGQLFTDQISQDWNGKVYEDLMLGLDHALKTYEFLDESRMAAAGGSYGGYMVDWIAGHTDRFKALITHAGVFDLTSMNVTTEELWFPEWEFGGSPWDTPEMHQAMSPSTYIANFKTPTLVIHGALDFRVPDAQGLGMYTALQRMGVPSRYVFFPDEGHWINKPGNRVAWWNEVHDWLAEYLKPEGR